MPTYCAYDCCGFMEHVIHTVPLNTRSLSPSLSSSSQSLIHVRMNTQAHRHCTMYVSLYLENKPVVLLSMPSLPFVLKLFQLTGLMRACESARACVPRVRVSVSVRARAHVRACRACVSVRACVSCQCVCVCVCCVCVSVSVCVCVLSLIHI